MPAGMTNSAIDDAAAEWAARLDRAPLAADERARLDAWLAQDLRHQGAFARARAVMSYFDRARALGSDFDAGAFAQDRPARRPTRRMVWAAAAGLAAVAGGGLLTLGLTMQGYRTRRGEMRRAPLPDGSTVTLNTASRILVDYKPGARTVRLTEGEALFSVHRDLDRPFTVEAGAVSVRATGAEFSVRRRAGREVEVMVCDGVVEMLRDGRVQRISAGSIVSATPARAATQAVSADEVGRRLAWREGMVAFHGETLGEAAAEFGRYADERIIIDDPAVARRTVVGLFVANDPINFAQAVAGSFGLQAERVSGGVRLSQPSSPA